MPELSPSIPPARSRKKRVAEPAPPPPLETAGSPDPGTPESGAAAASDKLPPYCGNLSPEARAVFLAMEADVDLSYEIRLIRTVLSSLCDDIATNHRAIGHALTALIRAVTTQAKQQTDTSDIERVLREAAEQALRSYEQ